jgi:uncharacterized protein YoxC
MNNLKIAVNLICAVALVGLLIMCYRIDRKAERIVEKVKSVEDSFHLHKDDLKGIKNKMEDVFKITKDPTLIKRK